MDIRTECKCEQDVYLRDRTWIHRGGKVGYWLSPSTIEELTEVGKELYLNKEDFVIIGHTSNMYFKDIFSIRYIIDSRKLTNFTIIDESTLLCDCGASMSKISRFLVDKGIAGYEGMVNLPGTVGGGIFNNSGCYGCGIEKVLKRIELLTPDGVIKSIPADELGFTFRSSSMKRNELAGIILRAYFDISNHDDILKLKSVAERCCIDRKNTQDPPAYNLGTTVNFFNPRKNIRNSLINKMMRLCMFAVSNKSRLYRIRRTLTCIVYERLSVMKYISDKRINCFLWKDEGADKAFPDYIELMNSIYEDCSLEIEVKG